MTETTKNNTQPKKATAADILAALSQLSGNMNQLAQKVQDIENKQSGSQSTIQPAVQTVGGPINQGAVALLEPNTGMTTVGQPSQDIFGKGNNCPVCSAFKTPKGLMVTVDLGTGGKVYLAKGSFLPPGEAVAEHIKQLPAGVLTFLATQAIPRLGVQSGQRFSMSGQQLVDFVVSEKKSFSYGLSGLLGISDATHPSIRYEGSGSSIRYAEPEEHKGYWKQRIVQLAARLQPSV